MAIDTKTRGAAIPDSFIGLSFETSNLPPDTNGDYLTVKAANAAVVQSCWPG